MSRNNFQRRHVRSAAAMVALLLTAWSCQRNDDVEVAAVPPLLASEVTGQATANGAELRAHDVVPWGATIEVAMGARVDLVARGNLGVRAWGPSRFVVSEPDNKGARWVTVNVGRAIAAFAGGSGGVRTPSAVAGVRGTVVYTEARTASDSYVCVCEGDVELGNSAGAVTQVVAAHHAALDVTATGFAPAGMLRHTDRDVDIVRRLAFLKP